MTLIVMAGLPGTGKTTLAKALVQALESDARQITQDFNSIAPVILSKDVTRAALFPPDLIEYSQEQDDFCLDMLLQVAAYLFRKASHRTIILDGRTFTKRYQVEIVEKTAADSGVNIVWIECVCDPEAAKKRLRNDRIKGIHPANNRGPYLYDKVKASAEPLFVPHITVDTMLPLQKCLSEILGYLDAESKT
jgi:adenylylsulfate kinase